VGVRWYASPDARSAAEACAQHLRARLEEALAGREYATLAVSGGATPKLMFEALAGSRFDWNKIHLFWVDERAVPPTDPNSNYRMVAESFLMPAKFPPRNVHRIHGEFRPEVAARCYATEIRDFFGLEEGETPHFDVIHRGVGADGHTASLFPGEPLLEDREGIAAAVYVEKLAQWRITLLPGVLLAAKHTVVLATGADKAEAVRAVFHESYDSRRYPAQMAPPQGRGVAWFLDRAAAKLVGD
jgi:6-phosphogluconolactonase